MTVAVPTALEAGLVACRDCGRLSPLGTERCPRCGVRLAPPHRRSLQAVWAFLAAGLIAYVPALMWPMLINTWLGREIPQTIVEGAVDLAERGSLFVAAVVLVASIGIPIAKFLAIGWIALTVARGTPKSRKARLRLHHLIEFIGRWSMIDVFVVAIVAGLVQLGLLASTVPGPAAGPFALSVALTMVAAKRLDPRLIWIEERR